MKKFILSCEITDKEAIISGKRHVIVIKPNGMRFYMDDFFMDVIKGMNDEDLIERLKYRYSVPEEYVTRAIEVALKGGFVLKEDDR